MQNVHSRTSPPHRNGRTIWTIPTVTRLTAGRAELKIGGPFDGSNKS
jgi:hypothetical protein